MNRAGAEYSLAPGELIGAILGPRGKTPSGLELSEERPRRRPGQGVEGGRVPDVAGDRAGSVGVQDRAQAIRDLVTEYAAKSGENIVVARFQRFVLGEAAGGDEEATEEAAE